MKTNPRGAILDVGCGNSSPFYTKSLLPHSQYTGIDIGDYNQVRPNLADHYIIVRPEEWSDKIASMAASFETIISSHNLEHCYKREETLMAIIQALKPGGYLFLSFPSAKSVNFPKRAGTLNYYDDPTHLNTPPDFDQVKNMLETNGFEILWSCESYRPLFLCMLGFLFEPLSAFRKRIYPGTKELYGLETVIWARKSA